MSETCSMHGERDQRNSKFSSVNIEKIVSFFWTCGGWDPVAYGFRQSRFSVGSGETWIFGDWLVD
jgi:hypothetical protein